MLDAAVEMGPLQNITFNNKVRHISSWYESYTYFITSVLPFIVRGGYYTYGIDA